MRTAFFRPLAVAPSLALALSFCAAAPPARAPAAAASVSARPAAAPPRAPDAPSRATLTWLGHAAFEIVSPAGVRIWIDPWLLDNPSTPAPWKDLAALKARKPDLLLVTHPHLDHASNALLIANLTGAKVVAPNEHLAAMRIEEAQRLSINVGGSLTERDVTIAAVPAMHSADPGGRPLGYVVQLPGGRTVYHTGDTGVFGDMALIDELYHPTTLLLACGGSRWGMDARQAALAVRKYFRPRAVVPMHYGTFAPLASRADVHAVFGADPRARWPEPGDRVEIE
jgi:L-ascorbate metabolism protein UlaG (beta-lactamase superfamily)